MIWLLQMFSVLTRTNIGNAKVAGKECSPGSFALECDLDIDHSQLSLALSVFFIGYVLCEVPSNIMLKKLSPSKWICFIVCCTGLIAAASSCLTNFAGLLTARIALGIAESGLFPGLVYYVSFWYKVWCRLIP